MESAPKQRIDGIIMGLMIVVAVIFDIVVVLLDLIPFIGWLVSSAVGAVAWLFIMIFCFKIMLRVDFDKGNLFVKMIMGGIIEVIPILNFLPGWTVATTAICLEARRQDFEKIREYEKKLAEKNRRGQTEDVEYTQQMEELAYQGNARRASQNQNKGADIIPISRGRPAERVPLIDTNIKPNRAAANDANYDNVKQAA